MKRLICFMLVLSVILVSCSNSPNNQEITETPNEYEDSLYIPVNKYDSMSDSGLLRFMEDSVYLGILRELDSDKYIVESVKAVYISQEYLEEVAYNSQSNIFFGYTLSELDSLFNGEKYIFTINEKGETVVKESQIVTDEWYNDVIKNVAIGTGIILVCAVVHVVSAAAGATAISAIFSVAAKGALEAALSGGVISGIVAGIGKGIETGDFNQAIKAALVKGSEDFKWGAIGGSIGGATGKLTELYKATSGGLSINDVAKIQKESKLPTDIIGLFKNIEEYEIYKNAGLKTEIVNDKLALTRAIDWNYKDSSGLTNAERVNKGLSPLDPLSGEAYELHHIGQKAESPLAILTKAEHMQNGNNKILHIFGQDSAVHGEGNEWQNEVRRFWKRLLEKDDSYLDLAS